GVEARLEVVVRLVVDLEEDDRRPLLDVFLDDRSEDREPANGRLPEVRREEARLAPLGTAEEVEAQEVAVRLPRERGRVLRLPPRGYGAEAPEAVGPLGVYEG